VPACPASCAVPKLGAGSRNLPSEVVFSSRLLRGCHVVAIRCGVITTPRRQSGFCDGFMSRVTRHGRREPGRLPCCAGPLAGSIRDEPATSSPGARRQRSEIAEAGAVSPRGGFATCDLHDGPFGARRRGRGLSRMPHMPDTPRLAGIASNGASRMLCEPRGAGDPLPSHSRCPPSKTHPPHDRQRGAVVPRGRGWTRRRITAAPEVGVVVPATVPRRAGHA
jgi:hypothetical protein